MVPKLKIENENFIFYLQFFTSLEVDNCVLYFSSFMINYSLIVTKVSLFSVRSVFMALGDDENIFFFLFTVSSALA